MKLTYLILLQFLIISYCRAKCAEPIEFDLKTNSSTNDIGQDRNYPDGTIIDHYCLDIPYGRKICKDGNWKGYEPTCQRPIIHIFCDLSEINEYFFDRRHMNTTKKYKHNIL